MPPIIVQQPKEYSKELHSNIPPDWTLHNTPFGYMDRYQRLKSMDQFSNVCGSTLSKIKEVSLIDTTAILMTTYLYIWITKTPNPSSWKQETIATTSLIIIAKIPNWSIFTTRWSLRGLWNMRQQNFYLTTWTPSWWKHGTPLRCQLETSSGIYLWKQSYSSSVLPT